MLRDPEGERERGGQCKFSRRIGTTRHRLDFTHLVATSGLRFRLLAPEVSLESLLFGDSPAPKSSETTTSGSGAGILATLTRFTIGSESSGRAI